MLILVGVSLYTRNTSKSIHPTSLSRSLKITPSKSEERPGKIERNEEQLREREKKRSSEQEIIINRESLIKAKAREHPEKEKN